MRASQLPARTRERQGRRRTKVPAVKLQEDEEEEGQQVPARAGETARQDISRTR